MKSSEGEIFGYKPTPNQETEAPAGWHKGKGMWEGRIKMSTRENKVQDCEL